MPIHSEINVKKAYTAGNDSMDEPPTCADLVPPVKAHLETPTDTGFIKEKRRV